jgi:flagellar basal body rod protein FlgC
MDLFKIFSISGAGMSVQRSRMTGGGKPCLPNHAHARGGPYKRRA